MLEGSTSGYFRPDGRNITLSGSWINNGPLYFVAGTGSVTLNGTTKDSIITGYSASYTNQFYDLFIDNPDSILIMDNIRVDNAYTQLQGDVDLFTPEGKKIDDDTSRHLCRKCRHGVHCSYISTYGFYHPATG